MRRMIAVAVAVLALAGCGGDDGGKLSEAFCTDLRAGSSPFQILNSRVQDGTYTPEEAARLTYGYVKDSCEDQLTSNDELRAYLEAWDLGEN